MRPNSMVAVVAALALSAMSVGAARAEVTLEPTKRAGGAVETVAERVARSQPPAEQAQSPPPPPPRFGRLRGSGEHFQREYETFDAEEREGHLFNDSLSRHEAHLETVRVASPDPCIHPRPPPPPPASPPVRKGSGLLGWAEKGAVLGLPSPAGHLSRCFRGAPLCCQCYATVTT